MSASDKKKLRAAERAEKLTEKQLAEQKEAKKLKLYSTLAVVVLVLLLVFAAYTAISRTVVNSGIRERNTVALTIGDQEISNAELNYYYLDAVNEFYSNYGSYAAILGLDVTQPLNAQIYSEEDRLTWADSFLESAIQNAKATYAIAAEAKAKGITLPEETIAEIDSAMETMELYATIYGYPNVKSYVKGMYGQGATVESLRAYYEINELARYYQSNYYNELTYTDAQLREAEKENYDKYSSYNYNYYYLNVNNFIEGESEDGSYTDEQLAAAAKAAEEAAKELTDGINTVPAFDKAIAALEINADIENAASFASENTAYGSIPADYAAWMTDASRKTGDITYIASTSTTTDESGNETEKVSGYYVVMFGSKNDNTFALANVRHILVAFEGGTTDSTTGVTTYTDDEKAAAKAEAEEILAQWQAGDANEDSFAALANEKSDDGDGTTGGLYEDIYPGQMVDTFEDWCFDAHEVGDTGIVESEYGYHVMFYAGDSQTTYRDHLISTELANNDYTAWYTALVDSLSAEKKDTQYINMGLVLSGS